MHLSDTGTNLQRGNVLGLWIFFLMHVLSLGLKRITYTLEEES